jgi:LmbE family N-acetylglucosaminyl deacetylase
MTLQVHSIYDPILLGMNDGFLDEDFTGQSLHQNLEGIIHFYQPDLVISWGPEVGSGHIDQV